MEETDGEGLSLGGGDKFEPNLQNMSLDGNEMSRLKGGVVGTCSSFFFWGSQSGLRSMYMRKRGIETETYVCTATGLREPSCLPRHHTVPFMFKVMWKLTWQPDRSGGGWFSYRFPSLLPESVLSDGQKVG